MPPSRRKPLVALSQVPSVKELCSRLGFDKATQAETTAFTDKTHIFRKIYKCSNGDAGSSLTDWNSTSVQGELAVMAVAFQEDDDNGDRFWSASRRWKQYDHDLTYPEDKKLIAEHLKQLFWKQNKYSLNNQTYIERKVTAAKDRRRDNSLTTLENSQSASTVSSTTVRPVETQEQRYLGLDPISRNAEQRGPIITLLEDDLNEMADRMESAVPPDGRSVKRNIFDVPEDDSDSRRDPLMHDNASHRTPFQTPSKNSTRSAPGTLPDRKGLSAASPLVKRPRSNGTDTNRTAKKKKLISPKRLSNRTRFARVSRDYVLGEDLDDLFRISDPEKERTSVSSDVIQTVNNQHQRKISIDSSYDTQEPSVIKSDTQAINHSLQSENPQSNVINRQWQDSNYPMATVVEALLARDSAVPSMNVSLPSSASGRQTPTQQSSDTGLNTDLTQKPRSKVNGAFWIITSPEPNYSEESWNNGQIKGKSLSKVIEEISNITKRDCIEKIKIKIKTAFAQTTTTVHKDAEDHWEIAKRNLEDKIKEAFARDRTKTQQTHFQIWIEPIYEQNAALGGNDDVDNGEIDW